MNRMIISLALGYQPCRGRHLPVSAQNTRTSTSPVAPVRNRRQPRATRSRTLATGGLRLGGVDTLPGGDAWSVGHFSPNLDPLTALGIEARSDEERRRYAELQVQVEAQRVEKTLAYQRAYDAAWQRLHPGMQRVNLPGASQTSSATGVPGDANRLAVFIQGRLCPMRPACPAIADLRGRIRPLHGRQPPG